MFPNKMPVNDFKSMLALDHLNPGELAYAQWTNPLWAASRKVWKWSGVSIE